MLMQWQRRLISTMTITSKTKLPTSTAYYSSSSENILNKEHYESHTSSSYDSAYFYSPQGNYTSFLCKKVQQTLGDIKSNSNKEWLLDIGGGTGTFTKMLMDKSDLTGVILDPYFNENDDKLFFVKGAADDLIVNDDAWWKAKDKYKYCLMKEVIHHLSVDNRIDIFRGILSVLKPSNNPSLLIITRPKYDIDYPLWPQAKTVWSDNQPSADGVISDLQSAGFINVASNTIIYPCIMNMNQWLGMVKGRVWSTFSHFDKEELDQGCDWIMKNVDVDEDGNISFEDRLIFITASKQPS